jgi:GTP-binding protein
VVADVPGLIEGAHEGAGLGIRFLKHVERTRLIAHLVDTSDFNDHDPVHDFEIIEHELAAFSPALAEKPMIVVATKLDATTNRERLEELRKFAEWRGLEFHAISSATGEGIVELVRAMANALDRIPKPAPAAQTTESIELQEEHLREEHHDALDENPDEEDHPAAPHREER